MKVDNNENVIPEGTPTQVAHQGQAIKRTLAVALAALLFLNGAIALVVEYFGVYLGEVHLGWLAGASGFLLALIGFLQKLIVMESTQAFLRKIGLDTGTLDETVVPDDEPIISERIEDLRHHTED